MSAGHVVEIEKGRQVKLENISMLKFVPEDFSQQDWDFKMDLRQIADEANARLAELLPDLRKQWMEELLKDAPRVYGDEHDYGVNWYQGKDNANVHGCEIQALLVNIEPVKEGGEND